MKKVSVDRSQKSLALKQPNMNICPNDQKNTSMYVMESERVLESQAEYIENLQQQIYVLESEIGYLRTHLQEGNKNHPSMVAEGEKMVKKLAEYQKEIQFLRIDLKRKQTSIDLIRSEKDRFQRRIDESEDKYRMDKSSLLDDTITLRKDRDACIDKSLELERLLQEKEQEKRNLQENLDNQRVELEQIKKERIRDKDIVHELMESKERLQKDLYEAKMTLDAKPSQQKEEAIRVLKAKIEEMHEAVESATRTAEHERLLRSRLSEDNSQLIKRHAQLESDLSESKALLREEQSLRSSLEQIHLSTVLEASESKSRDSCLKEELGRLDGLLKEEVERCFQLALQLADEQRFKNREEERATHLQERFEQRELKLAAKEKENTQLLRDNAFLKDQVSHLKQQLQLRDEEVLHLKEKVQDMQVSVEEFVQSSQAASRLAGERWKQLQQLAHGIQALTRDP